MEVRCIYKGEHDGNKTTVEVTPFHLIIFEFKTSVMFVCIEWKLFPYRRISARRKRNAFVSQKPINESAKFPVGNAS